MLGRLYGWNTLGAVVGAVAGHAVLIERFGIRGAALAAALTNAALALAALGLARRLLGKDSLGLRPDPEASSYWVDVAPDGPASRPRKPF